MYIAAALAAIIASISPFWGLIFIISFCGKYLEKRNLFLAFFWIATIILLATKAIEIITFFDVIIGVGLSTFIYFLTFQKSGDYVKSFLSAFAVITGFSIARQLFLGNVLVENINFLIENYKQFINTAMQNNPENLELSLAVLDSTKDVFLKYYTSIWITSLTFGLYFGTLLFSRRMPVKWQHKKISMPYFFIYLLILAMIIFILPNWKTTGINAMVILAPIFLIQGISILDFFWGEFFRRSKLLLFLLIISMVVNIPILILVGLIGLLDIWFDFRKIRIMEDINENHSG